MKYGKVLVSVVFTEVHDVKLGGIGLVQCCHKSLPIKCPTLNRQARLQRQTPTEDGTKVVCGYAYFSSVVHKNTPFPARSSRDPAALSVELGAMQRVNLNTTPVNFWSGFFQFFGAKKMSFSSWHVSLPADTVL